ncbi:MAG: hypothetical protein JSS66_09005 [Armatimonadetes bacterium]|nr:hypothetical protein [Armatimonadota bacterium]
MNDTRQRACLFVGTGGNSMRSGIRTILFALSALGVGSAYAGNFTPGNLVVSRVGDGSAALTSAATPVFLEEITTAGAAVQTIALPTADSGGNQTCTNSGNAGSEGFLSLSTDNKFVLFVGYDAPVGTAAIAGTVSATFNRVVGRVGADGALDTTTAFDSFNTGNIRAATSTDGSAFWMAGTGSGSGSASTGGARYVQYGPGNLTTLLTDAPTNWRVLQIVNGQLYGSAMSGTFRGVNTIGSGLPTGSGNITTLLPGFDPSSTSPQSIYDFAFADGGSTLYVADDRALASGGGLQKWTFDGTNWVLQYTIQAGIGTGIRGMAIVPDPLGNHIYATTSETSANNLVALQDLGSGSSFAVIATAPANTRYRGVCFTPVQSDTLESLAPVGQHVTLGQISSGDLASLAADDNNPERMCRFILPNRSSPFVVTELSYTSTKTVIASIVTQVKAKMSLVGQFVIKLGLKDQTQSNVYDVVLPETSIGTAYVTYQGGTTGQKYLGTGGAMVMQISVRNSGPVPGSGNWCTDFEFAKLDVTGH